MAAESIAQQFVRSYYETFDTNRVNLGKFYRVSHAVGHGDWESELLWTISFLKPMCGSNHSANLTLALNYIV